MKISSKLDIMTLALLLSSISGVLAVETVQAQNYVSDTTGNIDKYIQESCKKVSSGQTTIQIQLLNKNLISVECLNSAIDKVMVSAQQGGYVELNLSKGSC